jgi:hypothetical protein
MMKIRSWVLGSAMRAVVGDGEGGRTETTQPMVMRPWAESWCYFTVGILVRLVNLFRKLHAVGFFTGIGRVKRAAPPGAGQQLQQVDFALATGACLTSRRPQVRARPGRGYR